MWELTQAPGHSLYDPYHLVFLGRILSPISRYAGHCQKESLSHLTLAHDFGSFSTKLGWLWCSWACDELAHCGGEHMEESALLTGAGALPLRLKARATLAEDLGLVPNTHAGWLATT